MTKTLCLTQRSDRENLGPGPISRGHRRRQYPRSTERRYAMPKLDSMLLASTNSERLADWYARALSPDADDVADGYRVLDFGGFYLLIDGRDDVADTNADPARVILNFDVADAAAVVRDLEAAGTSWVAELEDRDGSLFATATDPDGKDRKR